MRSVTVPASTSLEFPTTPPMKNVRPGSMLSASNACTKTSGSAANRGSAADNNAHTTSGLIIVQVIRGRCPPRLRRERANFADARTQLLCDSETAHECRGLFELRDHRVD